MDLFKKVCALEARLRALEVSSSTMISRGTIMESDDSGGAQRQKISGFRGEEMTDVQQWQPFGLSARCPRGGDVLLLNMGGSRDGVQGLASGNSQFRQKDMGEGETVLYDAGGQTVKLTQSGIAITDQYGSSITMGSGGAVTIVATDLEITSGTLTHNGVNIGDDHVHTLSSGPANGGPPA